MVQFSSKHDQAQQGWEDELRNKNSEGEVTAAEMGEVDPTGLKNVSRAVTELLERPGNWGSYMSEVPVKLREKVRGKLKNKKKFPDGTFIVVRPNMDLHKAGKKAVDFVLPTGGQPIDILEE